MDKFLNSLFEFASKVDAKLTSPRYLSVLLGFWAAIGLTGAFLVISTFIEFDWMIFAIGLSDVVLGIGFGYYYYTQLKSTTSKNQNSE
jgi:uncharacterized membrane protein